MNAVDERVVEQRPATPRFFVRGLRRGVLLGVAFGLVTGLLWYMIVLGTTTMQSIFLPVLGVAVAYGVYLGMHRPGKTAALVSLAVTTVTVVVSLYFVERHLVVRWFVDNGDSKHIPLVPYLDWLVEILRHAFARGPGPVVNALLALALGGWFGFRGFESHEHRRHH